MSGETGTQCLTHENEKDTTKNRTLSDVNLDCIRLVVGLSIYTHLHFRGSCLVMGMRRTKRTRIRLRRITRHESFQCVTRALSGGS